MLGFVRSHVRLLTSFVAGAVATAWVWLRHPAQVNTLGAALVGWNVAVWLYLALIGWMMWRADHDHLPRHAALYGEKSGAIAVTVALAALASLAGLFGELVQQARAPGASTAAGWPSPSWLAWLTLVGSWLLVPTVFTLAYAHHYWQHAGRAADGKRPVGRGFTFPGDPALARPSEPNYADFAYVAFTISAAAQTSDVTITDSAMRRLALVHSLIAFVFNAAILGLMLNVTAGLVASGSASPTGASPPAAAASAASAART